MSTFPTARPSYAGFTSGDTLKNDNHAAQHNAEQADIAALSDKVGLGASTPVANQVLTGNGTGTSSWSQVNLTTMVSGVLPVANGGTGTTSTTGSGSVVFGTSPTLTTPVLVNATGSLNTPTIVNFSNAVHNHQNAAGGGILSEAAIDWSTFSLNIKSAIGSGSVVPTNGNNNFSSICSIAFTVSGTAYALVTVTTSVTSVNDFEHQPLIYLDGITSTVFAPNAQVGNASGRSAPRTFSALVTLTSGSHTLSPGAFVSAGSSYSQSGSGLSISAIVLGNVTA